MVQDDSDYTLTGSKLKKNSCPFKDPDDANSYDIDTPCPVCGATGHLTEENQRLMDSKCPD